jgi:ABC-2 type transport system permease protein
MKALLAVIRREYLQRVRSKAFIFGTIAAPLILIAMFVGPIILSSRDKGDGKIAFVDATGVLADGVVERLSGGSFEPEIVPFTATVLQEQDARVEREEIFGYVVLDEGTLSGGGAEFRGDGRPGALRRIQLQQAIVRTALARRLESTEADVEGLLGGGEIRYTELGDGESEGAERATEFAAGFIGAMILYVTLLLYGIQVMRSVLEEKTSRIVEVVISAIEPWQLMLGKILGVGAVALTQLGIWTGSVALLATSGLPFLIAARPELAELENLSEYLPAAGAFVLFFVFFVLGFFLFSGLYAAVAAMCSSDEEMQQTQIPVTMLIVVPILFLAPVIEDPNGPLAFWLSMVPFFSPVLMFPRYLGGAPLWQPLLSIVGVLITIVIVAWVAGRIYRVGILMQGKRPTLPELVRWVKEA